MNLLSPHKAISKLVGFNIRVHRLTESNYSEPRLRTQDLNRLKDEIPKMILFASIAIHNRNKTRAEHVISKFKEHYKTAKKIRDKGYL